MTTKRRRRWLWRGIVAVVTVLIAGELFARFYLGLGDPVLYRADPTIEYLQLPSRTYHRLGHVISYNSHSMRADEFPARKRDPRELRIMVLGDSVVNGGSRLDQSEIASELLKNTLQGKLDRPVVVGNISANSWGPPNLRAYVEQFGLFDADSVVIVLNSEDYKDVPTYSPLGSDYPTTRPILALQELIPIVWHKLVDRFIARGQGPASSPAQADIDSALSALRELIQAAQQSGATVIVVQHSMASELGKPPPRGRVLIAETVERLGIKPIDAGPAFARSVGDQGGVASLYLDDIHPSAAGQRVLANVVCDAVLNELGGARE